MEEVLLTVAGFLAYPLLHWLSGRTSSRMAKRREEEIYKARLLILGSLMGMDSGMTDLVTFDFSRKETGVLLASMVLEGLVVSSKVNGVSIYSITPEGRVYAGINLHRIK